MVIALLLSAALGGLLGFKLGDGTFINLGIGIGVVLVPFFYSVLELKIFLDSTRQTRS